MARQRRTEPVRREPLPAARRTRRWLPIVAAAGFVIVASVGWAAWSRSTAARLLPAVPDLSGQPAAVVAHLDAADRAARRSPTSADAVGALAMAYHADLLYEPALAAYRRASELEPKAWRWSYLAALVHSERGDGGQATEALRAVVAANPQFALAWWRLGEAELKRTRYEEAETAFAQAERLATAAADNSLRDYATVGRGRLALLRGDLSEAARLLTQVTQRSPRFGPAHRVLSEVLRAQGRAPDTDAAAANAAPLKAYAAPGHALLDELTEQSRSPVFLLRQAAATSLADQPARRERLVRRALESDPTNPDVVYEMGAVLQMLRRPADALPYFDRHLQLVPDDQQTLVQIGKCYTDLNRLPEAEAALRRALARDADPTGFYNLGVVLERQGRSSEAEISYRRAIALGPALAGARNNLGALLARSGRFPEAAANLLESMRLAPESPDAYTNYAAMLLGRGSMAEAARYARLAIDVDPRHADAHANLAVALAALGDLAGARAALEETLRLDPRHEQARRNLAALTR